MRMITTILAAAAVAAVPAGAEDFSVGDLVVEHPWAPPSIAGQNQAAVYMTIRNDGAADDTLVAAWSEAAGHVEFHAHEMNGDVARMVPVREVVAPAGEEVALAPGGMHLMLFDVEPPLTEGGDVPVTLEFKNARTVNINVHVEPLAEHLGDGAASGEAAAGHAHS